jgi:hypothetical protein
MAHSSRASTRPSLPRFSILAATTRRVRGSARPPSDQPRLALDAQARLGLFELERPDRRAVVLRGRAAHVIPGREDREDLDEVAIRIGAQARLGKLTNRQGLEARTVDQLLPRCPVVPAQHAAVIQQREGLLGGEVVPVPLRVDLAALVATDDRVQPGSSLRGRLHLPERRRPAAEKAPGPDCDHRTDQKHRRDP